MTLWTPLITACHVLLLLLSARFVQADDICDTVDKMSAPVTMTFGAVAAVSVIFFLITIFVTYTVQLQVNGKVNDLETEVHKIMDATLTVLLPDVLINEINASADETQAQLRKPKPGDAPPAATNTKKSIKLEKSAQSAKEA